MFSFNLTKFFAFFVLFFLLFSACRFWQTGGNETSDKMTPVAEDLQSEIPFSTKEPDQFQAEIVITANETERRTFVARKGANRRYDFNFGAKNQLTSLQTDKNYLILTGKKIYAQNIDAQMVSTDDWSNFLTTEWLSERHGAKFEKLETIDNITKYRVELGESVSSEMLISVDEQIGLAIKQQFYSLTGGQRILTYTVELKNLKMQADESLFAVPPDFRRVSIEELRKLLRSDRE